VNEEIEDSEEGEHEMVEDGEENGESEDSADNDLDINNKLMDRGETVYEKKIVNNIPTLT